MLILSTLFLFPFKLILESQQRVDDMLYGHIFQKHEIEFLDRYHQGKYGLQTKVIDCYCEINIEADSLMTDKLVEAYRKIDEEIYAFVPNDTIA